MIMRQKATLTLSSLLVSIGFAWPRAASAQRRPIIVRPALTVPGTIQPMIGMMLAREMINAKRAKNGKSKR